MGTAVAPSLKQGFVAVLAGNAVNAAAQWGIVVVLARVFDPTAVGQYALALAISSPVTVLASLKLRSVVVTDARGEYVFAEYLRLRLITSALALLLIAGIAASSGLDRRAAFIVLLVGGAKCLDAISEIFQAGLQKHEQMRHVALGTGLGGLLALALVGLAVLAGGGILLAGAGVAVASLVVLAGYQWPVAARVLKARGDGLDSRPPSASGRLWALTRLAAPLGVNILLGALATNVPRYFIENARGTHELGVFAAVAYFTAAGTIIINSAGQAVTPRLSSLYSQGDIAGFRRLLAHLALGGLGLGVAGVALAAVAGRWLLSFVYGPEYGPYADVLLLVAVAASITYAYIFLGTGVTAMRLFRVQVPISICTFLATVLGCAILVPQHGLRGAAMAMIASAVLEAALYLALILRRLQVA